jgi:hypothetical protein
VRIQPLGRSGGGRFLTILAEMFLNLDTDVAIFHGHLQILQCSVLIEHLSKSLGTSGADTLVAPKAYKLDRTVGLQAISDGDTTIIHNRVRRQINPLQGLVSANAVSLLMRW